MRVPDAVRDCVVFLGIQVVREEGHTEFLWAATGFFVVIPSETDPQTSAYIYLVTAKHNIDKAGNRELFMRINRREGEAAIVSLQGTRWYFHDTEPDTVDVAVLPFAPALDVFAYKMIHVRDLLTDVLTERFGIGVGDEVFMSGLFAHVTGKERNIPIVRMGNVAMMPNDTVPTEIGEIAAYLVEVRSIGGLSGSPVFVRDTTHVYATAASVPYCLMGLMHGHWKVPPGDVNSVPSSDFGGTDDTINMGIAMVVPAKKIMEVLNVPELRNARAEQDKKLRAQNAPVMDSAIPDESEHKSPAKPISLYPMSEEEALKRLLRVPPPGKGEKVGDTTS